MENAALAGNIQIELVGNGISANILKMYPYHEDGSETTREDVLHLLNLERVQHGLSREAIDYWLQVGRDEGRAPEKCLVAHFTPALRRGTERLEMIVEQSVEVGDRPAWDIASRFFDSFELSRLWLCEHKLCLVHEGQQLARRVTVDTPEPGTNTFGENIPVTRGQNIEFTAGEGVYLDQNTGMFTAGVCGYFVIKDFSLTVQEALFITRDRMQAYFINLPRTSPDDFITDKELYNYYQRNQIMFDKIDKKDWSACQVNSHVLITEGKLPGASIDAELELFFTIEKSIGEMDESGRIDYKEQHKFNSIEADKLLATKKLAIRGSEGRDLFGQVKLAPMPADIFFKQGRGTRVEKTDTHLSVYSAEEGVLQYEKDIISVFPEITIRGDVGMETGHIDSAANVQVMGDVLAGFNVKSKKNILINGNIEDNCVIDCGGDLNVVGGISGENTRIICKGTFSAKYIETCSVEAGGTMQVQRFLRGARITCHGSIMVFGSGINLNERGAIVDCEIRVRDELHVPVIGSDAGLTTTIWFAWDKKLYDHIENLTETVGKIEQQQKELNESQPVDINNPNVYSQLQNLDSLTKDGVIAAIQEKNKTEGRLKMMRKILDGELKKRDDMLCNSAVHISKKLLPDLVLHCHGVQRTIDTVESPSRFYFGIQTRLIDRSKFGIEGGTSDETE
ncbi:MAG: FapA family protein [Candidatus Cloacimonetes bacterium]|nr:FapA family protein [Candidatus Cloacimonadota bacterium]